jgi:hypothetical protein
MNKNILDVIQSAINSYNLWASTKFKGDRDPVRDLSELRGILYNKIRTEAANNPSIKFHYGTIKGGGLPKTQFVPEDLIPVFDEKSRLIGLSFKRPDGFSASPRFEILANCQSCINDLTFVHHNSGTHFQLDDILSDLKSFSI